MDFKRKTPKSSVFGTFLKTTEKSAVQSDPAFGDSALAVADPVAEILAAIDSTSSLTIKEALSVVTGGATLALSTIDDLEKWGLIQRDKDESGNVIIRRPD